MSRYKTKQKIMAMVLSTIMVVGIMPVSALAETGAFPIDISGEITAFETLGSDIAMRSVPLVTSEAGLELPDTLTATIRIAPLEEEPVLDSGKTDSEPDSDDTVSGSAFGIDETEDSESSEETGIASPSDAEETESDTEAEPVEKTADSTGVLTVSLPVTWTSLPEYDGETAGTYIFSPKLPKGLVLASDVETPTITVTVVAATITTGTVTAFDELPDDIRWQNTTAPEFPETVDGTVEDETAQIPVTWDTEQDYDAENPQRGLYVFTAVLGEGYGIGDGVELPRMTVYIPQTVGRMMARMAGGGTTDSPLEITTAAQLAEIATLVNARENGLELFLFNDAGAKVRLKMMNDIDLSVYRSGEGWAPIGNRSNQFKGTFDGGGHMVSNLTIDSTDGEYQGLFGHIGAGSVTKNLGVEDATIIAKGYIGGVAGYVDGGTVQNCYATGSIVGKSYIGGLVGCVINNSTVQNCYAASSIMGLPLSTHTGSYMIGGLAGGVYDSAVKTCYVIGNVAGNAGSPSAVYTGGLAGYFIGQGTIQNCAVLNQTVVGAHSIGRVIGSWPPDFPVGNRWLLGNLAFHDMTVTAYDDAKTLAEGVDQVDGKSKTAANIKAAGFFEELFDNDAAWAYAEGKLPGFGAAIDMPEYLVDGSDDNFRGAGTSVNPYQITTPAQLAKLAELVNAGNASYNAAHYKLMNDLDISAYNSGEGWMPIGIAGDYFEGSVVDNPFMGVFDGGGKRITGLFIKDLHERYITEGLFGYLKEARVKNLGVVEARVHAVVKYHVGGLAGKMEGGMVQNCYVIGSVTGLEHVGGVVGRINGGTVQNCYSSGRIAIDYYFSSEFVGGVAGSVKEGGIVENCYSTAAVGGTRIIGGVAGSVEEGGMIENCYSTGSIGSRQHNGGVAGYSRNGVVKNCAALNASVSSESTAGRVVGYISMSSDLLGNIAFDGMTVNGSMVSDGALTNTNGAPKTAEEINAMGFWTTMSGFTTDWDTTVWDIEPGKLPILKSIAGQDISMPAHLLPAGASLFEGAGTSESDPYLIKTAAQLAKLAELVNAGEDFLGKYFRLENDIDLSTYASGEGWMPIGTSAKQFNGFFNGNNKSITGLTVNRPMSDNIGLFGYLYPESKVWNIRIIDANVSGKTRVGGVVGNVWGATVENCAVTGNISGVESVGGTVGRASSGTVQNCYSTGSVTGSGDYVGGIMGYLEYDTTTMQRCYSDSSVSGKHYVGGVAGEVVTATVQNCYSTGNVKGVRYVGGVAGSVGSGSVQSCYSTGSVLGTDSEGYIGGVLGVLSSGTVKNCVALNPSIVVGTYNYGRVVGRNTSGLLLNNYAFSNVPGTWANKGSSAKDGTDVTLQTLFSANFWTMPTYWDTSEWDGMVWMCAGDKLPILYDLFALATQSGDGGLYLAARDIRYATVGTTATLTYNGSDHIPPLDVVFDGETLTKNTDYTVSITSTDGSGASAGTNVGEVTLTLTGIGSFKGTKTATYTIDKAHLTIVSASINSKTYDSTTIAEVANVSFDGLQLTETLELGTDYTVTDARFNSADAGDNKTVTATVTLANSATAKNYSLLSDALSISGMTIGKADLSSVEPVNKSLLYNAAHTNVTVDITGMLDDRGTTTFNAGTVTGDTAIISGTVQGTATGIKFSTNAGNIGQTAIIPVTATMHNYEDVVVDVVVTLVNKTSVTITGVAVANKVYDGTAIAYAGTPANAQGYIGTYQYVWSSGSVPKDAGSYTLTVKISDSNADFMGKIEIPFIISPATVTITAKNKRAYVSGTVPAFGESDYTVTGVASGETLNTAPTLAYTTTPDMSKTGTYTIIATGAVAPDSGNYNSAITYVTGTLTISNRPSGVGSSSDSSSVTVTPPATDKPNSSTQGEIKVSGTVDGNGNVTVNITDKAVTNAFEKALAEARKNGTEQNGITVLLRVDTGGKAASNVTVNLPKTVQDAIIGNKILNTIVVVDNPNIRIGIDLATVQEISRQAKSDVNITATCVDSSRLTGDAKQAIGNRPVFELKVNYGSGKQIQSFGAGSVSVSIPYTLGANEQAGNVQAVYVDAKGKVHWLVGSVYDSVEQVLLFATSHFSTYGIGYKQANTSFKDIAVHWAKEDIEFVVSRGLFSGTSNTTFSPNTAMTRGMFVTALGRLANADVSIYAKSSFSDVKNDAYYMGYIEWASKNNIVTGTGNGKFAPDQSITREQMAVIMQNYAKAMGFTLPKVHVENIFADNAKINAYSKDAVKQMQMAGVISGKNGNLFDPQGIATRAEVSAVLRRFVELAISSDTMQGWTMNDSGDVLRVPEK